jgi:hypothetical protein
MQAARTFKTLVPFSQFTLRNSAEGRQKNKNAFITRIITRTVSPT